MSTDQSLYQAVYDFDAENENELTLREGDVVQVYNKAGEWWEGQLSDGRYGLFPANRVVDYNEATTGADSVAYSPAPAVKSPSQPKAYNMQPIQAVQAPIQPVYAANKQLDQKVAADAPRAPQAPKDGGGKGGGGGGGGKGGKSESGPQKPVSNTKFGLWSSNMANLTAYSCIAFGIASMDWGVVDRDFGTTYVVIGIVSIIEALIILTYEYFWGGYRNGSKVPTRAIFYAVLSIPLFFSVPTAFGGAFMICVVIGNFLSAYNGEEYEPPKKEAARAEVPSAAAANMTIGDKIYNWIVVKKQQNRVGVVVFLAAYAASNLIIFFVALSEWIGIVNNMAPNVRLSGWAPWAKAFGNVLDFNCSIIVVPVLRSMIRSLYNASTANENCFAKCIRAILYFVPLDKNLAFHRLIAKAIMVATVGHTVMHLFNYISKPGPTMDRFGVWPWVSGGIICLAMLFMYAAAMDNVKRPQFEIFWYSHHLFILFFFFLLLHGHGGWNPNFWKWFLLPGSLYVMERLLRIYRAHLDVVLLSITNMKPNVISLEFAKEGIFASPYKEGQYIFIKCPKVSQIQWHPFTISSAPQEKTVTVHIKLMGPGSWTSEMAGFLSAMGPAHATYFELTRNVSNQVVPGKIVGPDGNPLLCIDGPHSAPTQHVTEYHTAMIMGAGIGVTPVAATLKSVVLHRWKYFMGHCFPDNAYFFWVCSHNDIESFRWLIRAIKDCEDEIYDMRAKNSKDMNQKRFEFHIFVSSVPKGQQPVNVVVDDDIGFWGVPREDRHIDKVRAPFSEVDVYKVMKCPAAHTQLGDVHIWEGRPKWDDRFQAVVAAHPKGEVGVAFCGNPMIGRDLKDMCFKYSSVDQDRYFKLHKENF